MAFTANNDINILQASDAAVVGAGAGNDTYVLSPSTLSANQEVTISDTQGANKLQLIGGLTIASSSVASNGVQLTLSNGAKVTVLGADTFSYEVGGNPLTGTAGTVQTYAQFATTTLGAASVPAAGASPVSGSTNVTIPGGSTGGGAGQTFSLTTATETKPLTSGNDTVDGSTVVDSVSLDTIIDSSTTDTDVANLVVSGTINPTNMLNVETVNGTAKYGSISFDSSKFIGTKTFNFDSAIASGNATVTDNAATTIAAGNNIATLTVTNGAAGATVAINAGAATDVTATGAAGADTMAITLAAGTNTVAINGNAGTDAYTINAKGGTLALTGNNTNNETLALNVSTGAQTVNVTTGLAKTTTVAGDQNVTIKGDWNTLTTYTLTNSLATGKTLDVVVTAATGASADLSKIAASTIELQAITTGATFANNANVKLGAAGLAGALVAASGATSLNVDLLKATTGTLTNSGFTTVNVAANTVAVTTLDARMGADATINLSGSKDVTASNTSAKLLNAANLTGKLVAEANATLLKVTGGSGADTLTVADVNLGGTAVVSAGTGNDTVTMKGTATLSATAANAVTLDGGAAGTDTLQFTTAGSDFSASTGLKGSVVTGFEVIDTNGQAIVLTQKQLFTNGGSFRLDDSAGGGSFTVTDDGASSRVIDLGSMTFGVGVTTSPIIIGNTTQANSLTGSAAADSITGGAAIDTIVGGAGVDTIVGGGANDALTGGTGADKFVLGNVTANGIDSITDFVAGSDKIYASGNVAHATAALALTDKGTVDTAVYTTLDAYVATFAAAQPNVTTASNAYKFVYGSDTYLLVDNGTAGYSAGTDALVKITGVSGTLAASDIINAA